MKFKIKWLFVLVSSFFLQSLEAQVNSTSNNPNFGKSGAVFSVAKGTSISIKANTVFAADSLDFTPSSDYAFTNNTMFVEDDPSKSAPTLANIKRVYRFTGVATPYSGRIKLYYIDQELNGLKENGLKLFYNTSTSWIRDNTSNNDPVENSVTSSKFSGISFQEVTAGKLLVLPAIGAVPLSQTICSGSAITPIVLTDLNNDFGTTFSWKIDFTENGVTMLSRNGTGNIISNVLNNYSSAAQTATYTIKASNAVGSVTKTSIVVVNPILAIKKQPVSATVLQNAITSFDIAVSGAGISYQWQLSTNNGLNWSNVSDNSTYAGAKKSKLTVSKVTALMNGYLYRCVVSGSCSGPLTSSTAKLTITKSVSNNSVAGSTKPNFQNLDIQAGAINSNVINLDVQAHPNPSSGEFMISVNSSSREPIILDVQNLEGKVVKSYRINSNQTLKMGLELAKATYVIVARQGAQIVVKRIVKQ
jgi:hypothetical protein